MAVMQMATLALAPVVGALASEADAAGNFRDAMFWACVLTAGFVVLGVAAWAIRRRLLNFKLRRSAGLTVEQVEKLYEDGMISREEFDRARRVVMGMAGVQVTAKPAKYSPADPPQRLLPADPPQRLLPADPDEGSETPPEPAEGEGEGKDENA